MNLRLVAMEIWRVKSVNASIKLSVYAQYRFNKDGKIGRRNLN